MAVVRVTANACHQHLKPCSTLPHWVPSVPMQRWSPKSRAATRLRVVNVVNAPKVAVAVDAVRVVPAPKMA